MAVKTDFYALLEIPRNAEPGAIEKAVRTQTSRWRKRTESSDLSTRQEAERRMELLTEAKNVLLNPQQRPAYDQDLATNGIEQATPTPDGGDASGIDWMDKARKSIERNDYASAVYATRMALQQGTTSAELWYLRSRANLGVGQAADALYEAKEAVAGESGNIAYITHLASVHESVGDYGAAVGVVDKGLGIEPQNRGLLLIKAGILLEVDHHDEALHITKHLMTTDPSDRTALAYHIIGLAGKAEDYVTETSEGWEFIDSNEDWDGFSACCDELAALQFDQGSDIEEMRQEILEVRRKMGSRTLCLPFYLPSNRILYATRPHAPIRRTIFAGLVTVTYVLFLFGFGLGMMSSGAAMGAFLGLLCWVLLGLGLWQGFKPAWKDHRNWVKAAGWVV